MSHQTSLTCYCNTKLEIEFSRKPTHRNHPHLVVSSRHVEFSIPEQFQVKCTECAAVHSYSDFLPLTKTQLVQLRHIRTIFKQFESYTKLAKIQPDFDSFDKWVRIQWPSLQANSRLYFYAGRRLQKEATR